MAIPSTTGPITTCPAAEVYAALWIGALLVAAGELADPMPPELDELAEAYFRAIPATAKA